MRLIDADKIVEVAEHAYGEWNLGMAAAEGRQINRCFKMQELCKAVKGVADDCPTIDPESLRPTAKWENGDDYYGDDIIWFCSACKNDVVLRGGTPEEYSYRYCPNCGARMVNTDDRLPLPEPPGGDPHDKTATS